MRKIIFFSNEYIFVKYIESIQKIGGNGTPFRIIFHLKSGRMLQEIFDSSVTIEKEIQKRDNRFELIITQLEISTKTEIL